MSELGRLLAHASTHQHLPVLVEGAPGTGGTALLNAMAARLAPSFVRVVHARCSFVERDEPFAALRRLVASAGTDPGTTDDTTRAAADRLVGDTADTADTADAAGPSMLGMLVVLDDAHLADAASVEWLSRAVRRPASPMRVLAFAPALRGGLARSPIDRFVADTTGRHLTLAPLGLASSAAMLREADPALDDDAVADLHRVTGGVPALLAAVCRELASRRARGEADRATAPPTIAAASDGLDADRLAIPILAARAAAQAERRTPSGVDLLVAVAVLGAADLQLAASVARVGGSDAAELADELVAAGLLQAGRPLRFAQPIVRTSTYAATPLALRSALHLRAAELLAAQGRPSTDVARHLLCTDATDQPWVAVQLADAAEQAVRDGDHASALRLVERLAHESVARPVAAILACRMSTLLASSDTQAAVEQLERAVKLGGEAADVVAAGELLLARVWHPEAHARVLRVLDTVGCPDGVADGRATPSTTQRLTDLVAELAEVERGGRIGRGVVWLDELAATVHRAADDTTALRGPTACSVAVEAMRTLTHCGRPADTLVAARRAADHTAAADLVVEARAFRLVVAEAHLTLGAAAPGIGTLVALAASTGPDSAESGPTGPTGQAGQAGLGSLDPVRAVARRALRFVQLAVGQPIDAVPDDDPAVWRVPGLGPALRTMTDDLTARYDLFRPTTDTSTPETTPIRTSDELPSVGGPLAPRLAERALLVRRHEPDRAAALLGEAIAAAERTGCAVLRAQVRFCASYAAPSADDTVRLLRLALDDLDPDTTPVLHLLVAFELGTTLRTIGRSLEARDLLRPCADTALRLGLGPLVARARGELVMSGARPRRLRSSGVDALTPAERRAATMAHEGHSNADIAALLYVNIKTVETHLARAYRKLGVRGRTQLRTDVAIDVLRTTTTADPDRDAI